MKKYESPKMHLIARGDMDIICASELLFPIIPLMGGMSENDSTPDNV